MTDTESSGVRLENEGRIDVGERGVITGPNALTFIGNTKPTLDDDPYGFEGVAKRLGDAVLRQAGRAGFVVGIEGDWGSGKSVMMARLRRHLGAVQKFVVDFAPWLVSNREALLVELFAALAKALADESHERGDAHGRSVLAAKKALAYVRRYEKGLVAAGSAIEAGALVAGPLATVIGKSVGQFGKSLGDGRKQPLSELKEDTCNALRKLRRPIVVFIDDVDRLEPQAAVELLRLVQAVADFPNVIYVLCYDRDRLAHGLQQFLKVDDGDAFLEKIVQLPITVPLVQQVDLEERFLDRLTALVGEQAMAGGALGDVLRRHIGQSFATPRSVNRVLDAIGFVWPGLEGKVDLADLVWLQFIRAADGRLYRWIEEYSLLVTSAGDSASRDPAHVTALKTTLSKLLGRAATWEDMRHRLAFVDLDAKSMEDALFAEAASSRTLAMGRAGSLASPEHARLYFGLIPTPGAEIDGAFDEIVAACGGERELGPLLLRLADEPARSGTPRLLVAIDRLANGGIVALDEKHRAKLLHGLLSETDALLARIPVKRRSSLDAALLAVLEAAAASFDEQRWPEVLRSALTGARADAFLTERLSDHRVQAPKLVAGEARRILLEHLLSTYSTMEPNLFVLRPDLLQALSIWKAADPGSFSALLDVVFEDDTALAATLAKHVSAYTRNDRSGSEVTRLMLQKKLDDLWGLDRLARRLPLRAAKIAEADRSALADLGSMMVNEWDRKLGGRSGPETAEPPDE